MKKPRSLKQGDRLKGEIAFTLYDTFGFPLDLTQDALERAASASTSRPSTPPWSDSAIQRAPPGRAPARPRPKPSGFAVREQHGATEFLGYETERAEGVVAALVRDGEEVDALKPGETGTVVLNQTPFYGESGGQVGDTGTMTADGVRFRVTDTQKKAGDLLVHSGWSRRARSRLGAALVLDVDHARRSAIRQTIPPPICCTRRCARCLAIMWRRRARWWRPTGCGSTSRTTSRCSAGRDRARSRTRPTHHAAERAVTTRLMALDEAIA